MPKKIMIVEDNELNLKLFTDLLRAHQFTVEGVRDGRLAIEQAKMFAPDLIIMDIQLPHISGLDIITAMQGDRVLAATPILAVTAYAGKGDEERILGAGAKAYLSKPVSVMKFLEAVRGMLA
jgi:two-component system, cell cycle response regulator DivK